jgi:hypothetical protein
MSRIEVEYDIDNAAFDETPLPETIRIFREITELIECGHDGGSIRDKYGNTIGSWRITDYEKRYEWSTTLSRGETN